MSKSDQIDGKFQEHRGQSEDRVRREGQTTRILAKANRLLETGTDYEATLEMIANLLVTDLACWCVIDLVTEEAQIERVTVVHRDPSKALLAKQILLHHPPSPSATRGVYRAIATGQSIMMPKTEWSDRADSPEHLRIINELGSSSYMCIPLKTRNKIVGSIMLLSGERIYDEIDLRTTEELARYMALAVDNVCMFRKMKEAVKVRDEFLATLSHELRTPLSVIQGWIHILKSETLDAAGYRQAFEILDRNSKMQYRMINDLLDVSRIISGKFTAALEPVDLTEILRSAAESTVLIAQQKNVSLQTDVPPEPQIISGDFCHLERLIINLLVNAVKFTPSGGLVKLALKVQKGEAQITVQDNGIGIDPEFISHIFESFRQEDSSTTRAYGGLGLGLTIAKHIVDQYHGQISATSGGKGKGTEVTIRLPLPKEPTPAQKIPTVTEESTKPVLGGVRILLVDDDEDIRFLLTRYLQQSGADVVAVSSAAQAFAELKSIKPHVLLSDIGMPEEDGYSLISRIRKLPKEQGGQIIAIALTAYSRTEEKQKTLASGFNVHLSKPIFGPVLIENISQLLQPEKN